jgi:hypothetical protein
MAMISTSLSCRSDAVAICSAYQCGKNDISAITALRKELALLLKRKFMPKVTENLNKWRAELSANSNLHNARQEFILFNEFTSGLLRETEEVLRKKFGIQGGKRDTIGMACLALLDFIGEEYFKTDSEEKIN